MTYLLISIPFLIFGTTIFLLKLRRIPKLLAVFAMTASMLLVLTIVFDNLMVWAGLFGFGAGHHLGIMIGRIPIEDLFYPLFAALIIPALWLPDHQSTQDPTKREGKNE
ncbi:lycopene cyclase domain-containing protein [Corynebacterium callunae]|uniref:lycopene cyclase domain-containing protein n=1 Tax=Corynebacterium callunae TaxID=1721 RepID=UPI003981EFA4